MLHIFSMCSKYLKIVIQGNVHRTVENAFQPQSAFKIPMVKIHMVVRQGQCLLAMAGQIYCACRIIMQVVFLL